MAAVTAEPQDNAESVIGVPVTPEEGTALAEAVILMRDHPRWAIWRPAGGENWAAIRPASSRPPTPELPTIWIQASTANELADLMQAGDEQISARGTQEPESRQRRAR
jgi:hypothetical protein